MRSVRVGVSYVDYEIVKGRRQPLRTTYLKRGATVFGPGCESSRGNGRPRPNDARHRVVHGQWERRLYLSNIEQCHSTLLVGPLGHHCPRTAKSVGDDRPDTHSTLQNHTRCKMDQGTKQRGADVITADTVMTSTLRPAWACCLCQRF